MTEHPTLIEGISLSQRFPIRGTGRLWKAAKEQLAVDAVSIAIKPGEVVALVGESGSGKTTLGRMLLGLQPPSSGSVLFRGEDIATMTGQKHREFRRSVQVVFQDSGASLNPRHRISNSLALPLLYNLGLTSDQARKQVDLLLDQVGLPPEHFRDRLPNELSGGQRQRVGIARALASQPALIVADEPVSALDVSVRAQILRLMSDLKERERLAYLFITHDLGVVRALADRVLVMLKGKLVEQGPVDEVLSNPQHEYTRGLLAASPIPNPRKPLLA